MAPGLLSTALATFLVVTFVLPSAARPGPIGTSELVSLLTFAGMGVFMSLFGHLYRRARGESERYQLERTQRAWPGDDDRRLLPPRPRSTRGGGSAGRTGNAGRKRANLWWSRTILTLVP